MKKTMALLLALLLMMPGLAVMEGANPKTAKVALAENPTTGYLWSYTLSQEGILKEAADAYTADQNPEGMEGVGGTRAWTFEAVAQGDVTVNFMYAQSFDPQGKPARVVSLTYRVDPTLQVSLINKVDVQDNDITVALAGNATTGYDWNCALSQEGILSEISNEYAPYENPGELVGVGGMHTWVFEAVGQGDVTATFTYAQPWEQTAAETCAYTFHVDGDNLVTMDLPGSADMTAAAPDTFAAVPQAQSRQAAIALKQDVLYVGIGKTVAVQYAVDPATAKTKGVAFASSDETVATVDAKGNVKGVAAGECQVTLTSKLDETVTAAVPVTVAAPVAKLSLSAAANAVNVGQMLPLGLSIEPENALWTASFKSSNSKVATVDENGVVAGIKAGSATITATALDGSKKSAKISIKVVQPPAGLHFPKQDVRVGVNAYTTISVLLEPKNATAGEVVWASSDKSVATVEGSSGKARIRGHKWGRCTVTATTKNGGHTASIHVDVGNLMRAVVVDSIAVKDGKPYIVLKNQSNMHITQVHYILMGQDIQGNTIQMSIKDDMLRGDYNHPLAPGEHTTHGMFTFLHPAEYTGLAHVYIAVTGFKTDTGYYVSNGALKYTYTIAKKNYEWVDGYSKLLQ